MHVALTQNPTLYTVRPPRFDDSIMLNDSIIVDITSIIITF